MDYTAHNAMVMKAEMKRYLAEEAKKQLVLALAAVAHRMVNIIDGDFMPCPPYERDHGGNGQFPIWTANMRDSSGVGVYCDGRLTSFRPARKAYKPQTDEGWKGWGFIELQKALSLGVTTYSRGVWIVLYSAVPYAYKVNYEGSPWGRGINFFGVLKDEFLAEIMTGLQQVR